MMDNIFISYRFTGEDPNELEYLLSNMKSSLETAGHIVICSFHYESFFQENSFTAEKIYKYMLEKQTESNTFLAFLKSEQRSKGMLLESNKALELKQKYVVVSKEGLYLPEFHDNAQRVIVYKNSQDLFSKMGKF